MAYPSKLWSSKRRSLAVPLRPTATVGQIMVGEATTLCLEEMSKEERSWVNIQGASLSRTPPILAVDDCCQPPHGMPCFMAWPNGSGLARRKNSNTFSLTPITSAVTFSRTTICLTAGFITSMVAEASKGLHLSNFRCLTSVGYLAVNRSRCASYFLKLRKVNLVQAIRQCAVALASSRSRKQMWNPMEVGVITPHRCTTLRLTPC